MRLSGYKTYCVAALLFGAGVNVARTDAFQGWQMILNALAVAGLRHAIAAVNGEPARPPR